MLSSMDGTNCSYWLLMKQETLSDSCDYPKRLYHKINNCIHVQNISLGKRTSQNYNQEDNLGQPKTHMLNMLPHFMLFCINISNIF